MAESFGASFNIDITNLKAGLKTANSLIKESESEFKKASAGMDDWTKSEEGLDAKIKSLNSIVGIQETKVRALKDEYARLVKEGLDETSDKAIKLRTQINKEEAALGENKAELQKNKDAYDNLAKSSDEAGNEIQDTGEKAEKSSGGFTVMKGALADLVASGMKLAINGAKKLASALVNVGEKADNLNTLSKQTGFTTTELQRFEYAADLVDVSVDDIVGSARKLKKNMVSESADTVAAFERIGVSARDDMTGELRDINDVFYDVLEGLSSIENATERDTTAMQLFGKNADELAGIIDDGGAALKTYGDEAENLGIVLSEDAVDAANDFNDSVDKIKNQAQGVFAQLGSEVANELTPELSGLQTAFQKIVKSGELKKYVKTAVGLVKDVISIVGKLAKTVLPPAAKAVKFLADNFKVIGPLILTAVTAFKTFKAVLAVKNTITAVRTALSAMSSAATAATSAQAGLNAVMSANPFGAVLTAVGLLTAGIVLLGNASDDSKDKTEDLTAAQKKLVDESDELSTSVSDAVQSYKDLQAEQSNIIAGAEGEYRYYQNLWQELQGIVDQNGNVKKGFEERASFITDQLAKAYDIEIENVGGVITKYDELKGKIEDVMKTKLAQSYLETQGELYTTAKQNIDSATAAYEKAKDLYNEAIDEQNVAEAQLNKLKGWAERFSMGDFAVLDESGFSSFFQLQQALETTQNRYDEMSETVNKLKGDYIDAENLVKDYTYNIGVYERNMVLAHEGNYDDMITKTAEYVREYGEGVEGERKLLEQDVENTKAQLKIMLDARTEANKDIYDEQIKASQKLLAQQLRDLQKYNNATDLKLGNNVEIWSSRLAENLSAVTGKNLEFKNAGNGLIQAFVDGEAVAIPLAATEMQEAVSSMLKEISDGKKDAQTAGEDFLQGLIDGIGNQSKQEAAFRSISNFGVNLLNKMKRSLQEKSPSKATRQMGQFLIEGLGLGIKDKEKGVYAEVSRFGKTVVSDLNKRMSGLNSVDFGALPGAVSAGMQSSGGVNNSKTVTVNQYNTYANAHSRWEIYKSRQETAAAVRLALAGGI